MNDIEVFINKFKSLYTYELEEVFTECNCYWFAVILHKEFNELRIVYSPSCNHFAVIDDEDQLYDIRGNVTEQYEDTDFILWKEYSDIDPVDYDQVKQYCIDLLD